MGLIVKAKVSTIADTTFALQPDAGRGERTELACDGLPAEWHPQSGVQLTWPHGATDWSDCLDEVERCYLKMAFHITRREALLVVTPEPDRVRALLQTHLPARNLARVTFFKCDTNDTWARDHALLTVWERGAWVAKDFTFNGWGGKFEAALDNAINRQVHDAGLLRAQYKDCLDFVLEGGSLESDGRGTLLVTMSCLLNPNRNPRLGQADIEARLKAEFHARRVLWLHHGNLQGDDTDGHIDTLARLCPNDTIAYVRCDDANDPHHDDLKRMEAELQALRTLEGEPFRLVALPHPKAIHHDGERLPGTYANFLVINGAVLLPTYNQPEADFQAAKALGEAFPDHEIVGIDCQVLLRQHGSLHCSTMQFPRGVLSPAKQE